MAEVRAWECDDCRVLARADAVGWIILPQAGGDLHFCPAHAEPRQRTGLSGQPFGPSTLPEDALPDTHPATGQRPSIARSDTASDVDRVTVIQLSFSGVQEPGGQVRVMVERKTATIPQSKAGSLVTLDQMFRRAHQDHNAWDDFVAATADYVATKVDNSAFNPAKEHLVSRDPLTLIAVNDALGRFQESLLELVGKPIGYAAGQAGAGPSVAAIAGGIGADDLLAPVSGLIQRISLVIDAAGMVFGAVTGMYPLAVACAHHLAGVAFHQVVFREVADAIDGVLPWKEDVQEAPSSALGPGYDSRLDDLGPGSPPYGFPQSPEPREPGGPDTSIGGPFS